MTTTRGELHRIGAHVPGRRRFEVSGYSALRSSPGGCATPAFGPEPETVQLAGSFLIREVGTVATSMAVPGSTMRHVAQFAGADLGAEFSAGAATPALGALDEPMALDEGEMAGLLDWFDRGWRVLDLVTSHDQTSEVHAVQLWPEHFDVGTAVELGSGGGLRFSAGDRFCDEPYADVGPWGTERPGAAAYWNAPFGAYLPWSGADRPSACSSFIAHGLETVARG